MISTSRSHLLPVHTHSCSDLVDLRAFSSAISSTSTPEPLYCTKISTRMPLTLVAPHCPALSPTKDLSLVQVGGTMSLEVNADQFFIIGPFVTLNFHLQFDRSYSLGRGFLRNTAGSADPAASIRFHCSHRDFYISSDACRTCLW